MCFGSLFKGKRDSENIEDDVFMELKSTSEDPGNYSTSPSADKLLNEVTIEDLRAAWTVVVLVQFWTEWFNHIMWTRYNMGFPIIVINNN